MALSHVAGAILLVCNAKERIYFDSTKFSPHFFITSPVISPYARLPSLHCSEINKRSARLFETTASHIYRKREFATQLSSSRAPSEFSSFGDKEHRKRVPQFDCETLRDSDRIQTCNLLIRSQMLYSVELRSQIQTINSNLRE